MLRPWQVSLGARVDPARDTPIYMQIIHALIRDIETGLVWMTKILTDPFSDLKLYYKAPLYLMKGELIDPGLDIIEHGLEEQPA